ncbi:MAG: hypothetical protein HY806_08575 [Nitrospirae bacterium]|nr:hypothetical protein [Nitrospirota bacterium]
MTSSKSSRSLLNIMRQDWFKALCLALLIILIIVLCLEAADRIFFRPKSIFARTVSDFESKKSGVEVLFLGQSDMQFAIIPDRLNYSAYNFAAASENFTETYYKLEHYIKDMPNLKIVVLPLNFQSFSSYRADILQWEYFKYGYISNSDLRDLYRLKGAVVLREKLISFCPIVRGIEMIDFMRNIKKLFTIQNIEKTEMSKGYLKYTGSDVTRDSAVKRASRHFKGNNIFNEDFLLYFEKILKLCADNNIKVFILTLPVTDFYIEQAKQYVDKDVFYNKALDNPQYSKYIYKHLDLLEIYAGNHDLFLNSDHLNYNGAAKVTDIVAAELSR